MNSGCYLIKVHPAKPVEYVQHLHGTLRVSEDFRASADLYSRPDELPKTFLDEIEKANKIRKSEEDIDPNKWPDPTKGIPTFPRAHYYGYMEEAPIFQGMAVDGSSDGTFSARFRFHLFDHKTNRFNPRGFLSVIVNQDSAEAEKFKGKIINDDTSQVVASIELQWVSDSLRKAVLEIDAVEDASIPMNNDLPGENSTDWQKVFEDANWELSLKDFTYETASSAKNTLSVIKDDSTIPQTEKELLESACATLIKRDPARKWTDSELHAAMLILRRSNALDTEWRYHLLCVGEFANPQYERGVMYDVAGVDTNEAPREGAAIAAGWPIPKDEKDERTEHWKAVAAEKFGEAKDVYFRTAVHEIGHAMGLGHSYENTGFMNTTDTIARMGTERVKELSKLSEEEGVKALMAQPSGSVSSFAGSLAKAKTDRDERERWLEESTQPVRFPNNIKWSFSTKDINRLRHGPDVMVRPGAFNVKDLPAFADENPLEAAGLKLHISPLLEAVTFGAPVRIRLRLENVSDQKQEDIPSTLHLKSGFISGEVIDPRGNGHPFDALMRSLDTDRHKPGGLDPKVNYCHSITLLRGNLGALFSTVGVHRVKVSLSWNRKGKYVVVRGETPVNVTPPANTAQRMAALRLLSAPRSLFSLAIGGGQDKEAEAALSACLADPFLAPHYRVLRAKQLIEDGKDDNILEACRVLSSETVLSISEIYRLRDLLLPYREKSSVVQATLEWLKAKWEQLFSTGHYDEIP